MTHPGRSEEEARATLRRAYEAGVRLFDTADRYADGRNERLVADALEDVRDEVVIATKFGFVGKPGRDTRVVDGSPGHVRDACDASLRRLRTDRIDLWYLHRLDPMVPVEETVGAMAELVEAGKVARIGLSEVDVAALRRAEAVHPIAAVQNEFSLSTRGAESEMLPACRASGVAFVGYSPLGIGLLTGCYLAPEELPDGNRLARGPRMDEAHRAANLERVAALRRLADSCGMTPAQLALAWVLAQGAIALPGSARRRHLDENVWALRLRPDADVMHALEALFPEGAIAGARKPPPGLALTPG